jgi:hypothetical protein
VFGVDATAVDAHSPFAQSLLDGDGVALVVDLVAVVDVTDEVLE